MITRKAKILLAMFLSMVVWSCNTSEEELLSNDNEGSDEVQVIDLNDDAYTLAKYRSEDNGVEIRLVEVEKGDIVITMSHHIDADVNVLQQYNSLVDDVSSDRLSLDQFYANLPGQRVSPEMSEKLLAATDRLKKLRATVNRPNMSIEQIELNAKNASVLMERMNRRARTSSSAPVRCASDSDATRAWFFQNYCNGRTAIHFPSWTEGTDWDISTKDVEEENIRYTNKYQFVIYNRNDLSSSTAYGHVYDIGFAFPKLMATLTAPPMWVQSATFLTPAYRKGYLSFSGSCKYGAFVSYRDYK